MRLLLDTHVVLWWLDDPNLLSADARDAIAEPANQVFVSAVVAWEIAIKRSLGKLNAPADIASAIVDAGFDELPVTSDHAWAVESLPNHHRDPFDRMLIAQAIRENCTLVSRDAAIPAYSIPLIVA
ncbi:PIN domain nuclease of toxin-antitoxin system [Rhodopirellula rubra]|uniref:PIN domain nuclease of toxin-antitoxin system n=1 Tax=Aporhodopirellula rubra TaxID=980271 RepID=A0A7W5H9Y9_9BACT|nr:type II toxin-antitoxin system VapC family toxin [Aporhodopirellula rubra]MBB3210621.1 PIN domain nuclease of toxin-antitoxin system [Aporhodopirellula rubra]